MSPEFIAVFVVGLSSAAALASPWGLHGDVADLRGRVAGQEGSFEGFARRGPAAPGAGTA